MRKSNFFVTMGALVCAVMVSSCSVNDDIEETNNGAVRFTAGIGEVAAPQGAPVTKAAGTTWANGDAIGVFMKNGATVEAANKQYTTTGYGTFTAVSGQEMYYPMDNSTVSFIAYYPYESGVALATPINVEIGTTQTAASQATFDLLYSTGATGKKSTAATPVALNFDHKLAKIVMTVKADASVGMALTGMTVKINGMYTKNTFNLSTGQLGNIPTVNNAPITPRTITDGSAYDAIILPYSSYSADEVTVEFTLSNNEVFTWKLTEANAVFAGGNEYSYEVTLTRTGVNVTGTINPWTTLGNDRGGVTAD